MAKFLLFFSIAAHSAVLAVLEIVPTNEVEELTVSESRLLTDELRRQALNILSAKDFTILTRDGIIALIPPDEKEAECLAESCAVDIGRVIGVEYISIGHVAKFAGKLSLTVELYETMGGRLLGSFLTYGTDVLGLMKTIESQSPAMFERVKAHYFGGKDVAKEVAEDIKTAQSINTGIKTEEPQGLPKWVAVSLDVLGAGAIGFGIYQNSQVSSRMKTYNALPSGTSQGDLDSAHKKAESSQNARNVGYIAGGILLICGIGVHIWF